MEKAKRRTYFLSIVLLIVAIPVFAQDSESNAQVQQLTNPSNTIVTNQNKEIHGSPFFNEDWDQGYVLYNGKVKLQDKHGSRFLRGQRPDSVSGIITSNFINKEDFFLVDLNGNFHDIKLNKDILKASSTHKKEIKAYADRNDLSFKHPNELKKILAHNDELISK